MATAPVSSDIDPRRVLAALGYADASDPVAVTGGWETLLWHFVTPDGGEHALRVFALAGGEQAAWRERVAMETCAAAGIATPRIEATGIYDSLPVIVQTWCRGDSLINRIEKKPWQMLHLGRRFGRLHARLHTIPAPAEFAAGAPGDWLARVLPRHAHLAARLQSASSDTLVHRDYHPLNVIVNRAGASRPPQADAQDRTQAGRPQLARRLPRCRRRRPRLPPVSRVGMRHAVPRDRRDPRPPGRLGHAG